jgi:putative ABC transport system permease protein
MFENVPNDLRFAMRQLRRSPAFAVTAVLTLALGIGANTAIFSLLDQALLRSLPVREPESLVILEGTGKAWQGHASDNGGDAEAYFSYPMYKDLRDQNKVFEGLIATVSTAANVTRNGASQLAAAELVSGNYFDLLGVGPAMGRLFTQSEDVQKDGNPVAVLSFEFWRDHMGADPSVVGSQVMINAHPFQVIGVTAPRFHSAVWGQKPALFIPMTMIGQAMPGEDARLTNHKDKWMNIIGRLKQGETRSHAEAAMNPLWHALRADELKAMGTRSKRFTDDFLTNSKMKVLPGASGFSYARDGFEKPLLAIMAMASLVLLMAVVNVASLLLVRSAGRVREFSLRFALGANGGRIVQQLLLEGLLIGVAGGLTGMALAPIAIQALVHRLSQNDGYVAFTTTIDARLVAFNFLIALGVSLLFSLAPALQLRKPDLSAAMGQRMGTNSGAMLSFRRVVVCLQIGLSVLLLVGAGLFVRTMQNLRAFNVGFTTSHLITFGINPLLAGYTSEQLPMLEQRVQDRLSQLPGVQMAGTTDDEELAGNDQGGNVTVAGYTPPPDDDFSVEAAYTSPGYLATMQIPLIAGRYLTDTDDATHPGAALVNESFVKHFCGASVRDCLGRMMGNGGGSKIKTDIQIVGVVRDAKHSTIRDEARATMFRPLKQAGEWRIRFLYFYVRTYAEPAQALQMVRRTMQELDPALALRSLQTMDAQVDESLSNDRMVTLLAISFGLLATVLAGVGLYGVLAYSTAQRTREIGVRIALGSSRIAVSRLVLGDVLRLAGLGVVVALPVAYGLSRLLRSQLFGVSPADPLTLLGVVVLIALVAVVAAAVPARRAASINPTEALRAE